MEINNMQRVQVITEALPYIQKYYNKIIVVKYGGNAMINEELKEAVMGDIVLLTTIGIKVVLVHGGGSEITKRQCLDCFFSPIKKIFGKSLLFREPYDII